MNTLYNEFVIEPELTIATVTFNSLAYTQLFVRFLQKHADVSYHLIVVDNHSTDGTRKFLSSLKNVEVILNKRNLGFSQANNQAFLRAKTPYFLGLNNDTAIFPGFLSSLIAAAKKYPDYAEFGVNSNCIGAKNPRNQEDMTKKILKLSQPTVELLEQQLTDYYQNFDEFFRLFKKNDDELEEFEVPPNFIGGWCYLVQTKLIKKLDHLLDRKFKIGFWEDVDLSWRLALAGHKIGLLKNIYLHHYVHASFDNGFQKKPDRKISLSNSLYFAEKWSDQIRSFLLAKFNQGLSLPEICQKYFIFAVYFGKARNDWPQLEMSLKATFLKDKNLSFKQFLTLK